VADVFRRYGDVYRQRHDLPPAQHRVMTAIERCRTAALGGHVDQCGHRRISYNSLGCVMTFVRYREDQWLTAKL
jgi:hypothetical protein